MTDDQHGLGTLLRLRLGKARAQHAGLMQDLQRAACVPPPEFQTQRPFRTWQPGARLQHPVPIRTYDRQTVR